MNPVLDSEARITEVLANRERYCAYPCHGCGKTGYYIDLQSPERHHLVRAAACVLTDGTVPFSGQVVTHDCGHPLMFL